MATTTIELRHLLMMESFNLFDFNYPIVDNTWKTELENFIADYFYFYEVCAESVDRFKHNFKVRLMEIMPYYNKLYETTLIEIKPLITQELEETITNEKEKTVNINVTNEGESIQEGNGETIGSKSDYPQNENPDSDILSSRDKATSISSDKNTTTSTQQGENKETNTDNYYKKVLGVNGNQSELLQSYRQTILNINQMIVKDLKPLFILVY